MRRTRTPRASRAAVPQVLALAFALALGVAACGATGEGDGDGDGAGRPTVPRRPPTTGRGSTAPPPSGASTTTAAPPDLDAVRVALTEVASGLDSPVAFAVRPGDDTLYVAEQSGRVRAVRDGAVAGDAVLDIADEVSGGNEQGLLGITFSPDGSLLYVDYTDVEGHTHVQEFAFDGGAADEGSEREILYVEQPFANHNGGHVTFGPDGMLYVSLGDGGSAGDPQGNGQRLDTLLGKILRIDPRPQGDAPYSVPADNPFVDDEGARPEIWQYGLRNPWRFSFDRANGDLWIGDVGQFEYEEIDYAPAGEAGVNWGWNRREGLHPYDGGEAPPGARDPVFEYTHAEGGVSVTGGFVYRGDAIDGLAGAYVFADYAQGDLIAITQEGGRLADQASLGADGGEVTSFGEDAAGEIYVLDRGGRVLRLDPA